MFDRDPLPGDRNDDPLVELASLWRRLAPPDPTAVVDAPDAATRATVAWLRDAWCALAPASPAPPWRIRVRATRRRLAPYAAAAALLIGVTTAVALLLPMPARAPGISRGDRIVDLPFAPVPAHRPPSVVAATPFCDAIPLVAFDAGRMEMRRGPVRLILVTPPPLVARNSPRNAEPGSAKEPK